jgi:N-acetyl-gamma-glutamyl-phosphate reductase
MIKVGIFGATGYAGYELVRIVARHPQATLGFASSETYAGKRYGEVYPCAYEDVLVAPEEAPLDEVDVVFLCTPHAASAPFAARALQAGCKCVDLSADFRLRDLATYETWYGPHGAPELLPEAVYGLTEVYRAELAKTRLVANPGCYPTGPLLALYPLLARQALASNRVIIDAKSGVSGAGAKPSPTTHFVSVNENLSAYAVGRVHRHVPEIDQELRRFGGTDVQVTFVPHLLPVTRGILSSIYVSIDPAWSQEAVLDLWREAYAGAPFVRVCPAGTLPTLAHVANTNYCYLGVASAGLSGEWVIVTALDNLIKGASGQAVQNMNVMCGLDETLGLLP